MAERRALAAVALAALVGLVAQYLLFRQALGINLPIVVALLLGAASWQRDRGRPLRRADLWIPAAALTLASFCAVRVDQPLVVLDVLATLTLLGASIPVFAAAPLGALAVGAVVREALATLGRAAVGGFDALVSAWPMVRVLSPRLTRASGPLGGAALAAPFLIVFAMLFSSADAVFARSLDRLIDLDRLAELLGESPARLLLAFAVAWPAAGAFTMLWRPPREQGEATARPLIAADSATVALVLIDALFAVFVALQVAYLFGGRDTLDAAALTYSAYARRGFFELIAVVALVGGLLFALELVLRQRGRAYVSAALALVALSVSILVSASYRLDLYQRAYGWSEPRLYALTVIAFLAAALGIFGWSVARGRMAFAVAPLAAAATVALIALNLVGPSGFVARANLDRAIDPSGLPDDAERDLDIGTLWSLGEGALPAISARVDELRGAERSAVEGLLHSYTRHRDLSIAPDWRGWNADRERARIALREWEDRARR